MMVGAMCQQQMRTQDTPTTASRYVQKPCLMRAEIAYDLHIQSRFRTKWLALGPPFRVPESQTELCGGQLIYMMWTHSDVVLTCRS